VTSYGLEVLGEEECRALLASHAFGRLAVWSGAHPAVLPVLYGMLDGDVVIRTAPGEKLIAAVLGQEVAFEVDEMDAATRTGWSVNVVGRAEQIVAPGERERAEALGLEPWAGEYRDEYVRVRCEQLTGRRVRPEAHAREG
jgi:nitroimidazol reductase NimA-like FMN-containing flavoprotein (pyridoxamine 5'-phosphate oxidase superfamily)